MAIRLTIDEANTVINSLRLAAEKYRVNAAFCRAEADPLERMAQQFDKQAADADALALRFEDAEFPTS